MKHFKSEVRKIATNEITTHKHTHARARTHTHTHTHTHTYIYIYILENQSGKRRKFILN